MKSLIDRTKAHSFILLHVSLFLYAAVGIFQKISAQHLTVYRSEYTFTDSNLVLAIVYFGFTVEIIAIYAVLWQLALKKLPLNIAYANKGICTVWTAMFGILLFQEPITPGQCIGFLFVIIGVFLVVTDS